MCSGKSDWEKLKAALASGCVLWNKFKQYLRFGKHLDGGSLVAPVRINDR